MVPTDNDWANLLDQVESGGTFTSQTDYGWIGANAGGLLRSASTYVGADLGDGSWVFSQENQASDLYGFTALPSGMRYPTGSQFYGRGQATYLMTSSAESSELTPARSFQAWSQQSGRSRASRSQAVAVRCRKL
ncbi:MAG: fibrobacter succinogenes major paralogous domain-containing protein [Prevotellaceae bacterium]|nr:fibrobacter succinogenes major paralogous domain-containing protein [Prevotellaceae bacterium]